MIVFSPVNVLRSRSHLLATNPKYFYDYQSSFPQGRVATGSYACYCRFYFQYHGVCTGWFAVRHCRKLSYANRAGRHHANHLRLGSCLMSLPFMLLTSQMERRKLLICLFVLFIASHVLSFLAWNFTVLVISRIGIAFAHAIFWSITASLAIRLAPAGKRAQALSLIATGTALAMVLGLPIGRVVGQYFGWRTTFFAIGMGALITLLCLIKLLPKLPSEHSGSLKSLPLLFRRPALMSLYILTVVVVTAHYTAYSYIEPFVQNVAGLSANFATVLLLILGGAGIIGSLVFGKLGNHHASLLVSIAIALLVVCLLLLLPAADSEAHLALLSIFWGIAIMVIGLGMQVKVLALAPDATDVAMALFSGIFNIGIGAGALAGNQVSLHWSMSIIGYIGAIPAFAALVWAVLIFRK